MSLYVLSLVDWEDYKPYWFECDCTEEVFKAQVQNAMDFVTHYLIDTELTDGFIDGYELLDKAVEHLQGEYGHKLVKPVYEISMHGMCLYTADDDRPETIPEGAWNKIVEHNDRVRKDLHDRLNKEDENG